MRFALWPVFTRFTRPPRSRSPRAGDPIEQITRAFADIQSSGDIPGLEFLTSDISGLLRQWDHDTPSIANEKRDPRELLYTMIANVAHEHLCSGRHPTYRGVLTYEGTELPGAFIAASS